MFKDIARSVMLSFLLLASLHIFSGTAEGTATYDIYGSISLTLEMDDSLSIVDNFLNHSFDIYFSDGDGYAESVLIIGAYEMKLEASVDSFGGTGITGTLATTSSRAEGGFEIVNVSDQNSSLSISGEYE